MIGVLEVELTKALLVANDGGDVAFLGIGKAEIGVDQNEAAVTFLERGDLICIDSPQIAPQQIPAGISRLDDPIGSRGKPFRDGRRIAGPGNEEQIGRGDNWFVYESSLNNLILDSQPRKLAA